MAHIRRLMYFALGFILAAFSMVAWSATGDIQWKVAGDDRTIASSPGEACNKYGVRMGYTDYHLVGTQSGPWQYNQWSNTGYRCAVSHYGTFVGNITMAYFIDGECPDGMERNSDTGQCEVPECPEGQVRNPITDICQDPCPDPAQAGVLRSYVSHGGDICNFGCKRTRAAVPGGSNCALVVDVGGESPFNYACDYYYTGEMCGWSGEKIPDTENIENTPPVDETECGAGYQSVTLNGQKQCVKESPPVDSKEIKKEKTPVPDGGEIETITEKETIRNPDGTVREITNTTQIIRDSTGAEISRGTTTTEKTQGGGGYCSENPTALICGGGGSGNLAGGCEPGGEVKNLACDGDPIACAIREQTMRTYCQLTASKETMDQWEVIKSFEGTGEGEGLDRKEIDVTTALNVSPSGGGGGLQDQVFSVLGKTIVLPFSRLNTILDMFGYAVLAIAWLQAFRIIAGIL